MSDSELIVRARRAASVFSTDGAARLLMDLADRLEQLTRERSAITLLFARGLMGRMEITQLHDGPTFRLTIIYDGSVWVGTGQNVTHAIRAAAGLDAPEPDVSVMGSDDDPCDSEA